MDGTAGVSEGDGDARSCSDPSGGGPRPSTPLPAADRKYVCLRSLVGASSSSSSASREAMLPGAGARKALDVGARLWVPVASDGSSGSDTDGGVGSPSSPASTLHKPLLRGRSRHGLHGGCRDAELQRVQTQAREGALQPHHLDYKPHVQVLEQAIQCSTPNMKEELAVTINRAKEELEYEKGQKVVEEIANNVKDISVRSSEIVDHLKCMSSHVNQELAVRRDSREKDTEDQERQKILQIKIEEREKRETEEKSQKEDANFLKECQSMLSDFVFIVLAFIPWILHKNEETRSTEYYCLTFSVSGLVLLGMGGYVLSHLARSSRWIKAVYWISGIAIMATILLVVYVLFELIPSSFHHMTAAFWVYLCLYLGVGLFLLMAWIHNICQA